MNQPGWRRRADKPPATAAQQRVGAARARFAVPSAQSERYPDDGAVVDEVIVRPSTGHVGLRLFKPERGREGLSYYSVEAGDSEARARVHVHDLEVSAPYTLPGFIRTLAQDWRDWLGERSWGSFEGELNIRATSEGLGHITLMVSLVPEPFPPPWESTGRVLVEAGQLETYASLGLWIGIGLALGTGKGTAAGNVSAGVAGGLLLGVAIGVALQQWSKRGSSG
jgi:hypothetical protein